MYKMSNSEKLKNIYFDAEKPASFYSIDKFNHALKRQPKKHKISRQELQHWLETQDAYTLHRPHRLHFPRRNYNVHCIDDLWETDLIDLQSIKSYNDNYAFIIVVIDAVSRYVWVEPLLNKSSKSVADAFQKILARSNNRMPSLCQSDAGKEYTGAAFQKMLKENDIHFRIARNPDVKCALAERFNRTLKDRMWRYFTNSNTKRYIDVLQSLVNSYNNTVHSGTKMAPSTVNLKNASFAKKNLDNRYAHHFTNKRPKYSVGDLVRVSTAKNVFQKSSECSFTEEIFKIVRISQTRAPYVYILQDLAGEEIDGIFYEEELSRVRKDLENDTFIVKEVLKTRGKGRAKEYFVSWQGFPEKFNSWIRANDLVELK